MNHKKDLLLILKVITDYLGVFDANRTHNSARVDNNLFCIHKSNTFLENLSEDDLVELSYHNKVEDYKGVFPMIYDVHSSFYRNTDCDFFIHFHDPAVVAVANSQDGLLPLSQESLHVINDTYHKKYTGLFDEDLSHDFSDVYNSENKSVVLIQGHGGLVMGKNAQDTLLKCYMLIRACRIQSINNDRVSMPAHQFDDNLNSTVAYNLYKGFVKYYGEL